MSQTRPCVECHEPDFGRLYIYIYMYPSLAPESSSPRRTRKPDSYVYGHLKNPASSFKHVHCCSEQTLSDFYPAATFREVRCNPNLAQVWTKHTRGQLIMLIAIRTPNTQESERPPHVRPTACVLAQQYPSATFVSIWFHSRKQKIMCVVSKTWLFQFLSSSKSHASEIA
jgi:hypothetical protein